MLMSKNTMIELVSELEKLPQTVAVKNLIKEAKAGEFHDYKATKYPFPKSILTKKLGDLNLFKLRNEVMNGEYDEEPDKQGYCY